MKRKTVLDIKNMKGISPISALTCYSYFNAVAMDEAGIDIILIGDSVGNVILGYDTTIKVEVEDIIYHSKIVASHNKTSFIVSDMPFMSYQVSKEKAIENAGKIIKYGYSNAVKIEGGEEVLDKITAIISAGIPVMGHLGLMPQSINKLGKYCIQGITEKKKKKIIKDALLLEKSGVFAITLECIPEILAKEITEKVKIPTIGIGAGRYTDGQILVVNDILGLNFDKKPKKFVKVYKNIGKEIKNVFKKYNKDVKNHLFPDINNIIR